MSYLNNFCNEYFQNFNHKTGTFKRFYYFGIAFVSSPLVLFSLPLYVVDFCLNLFYRLCGFRDNWIEQTPEILFDIYAYYALSFNPDYIYTHQRRNEFSFGLFLFFPFIFTTLIGAIAFGSVAFAGKVLEFVGKFVVYASTDLLLACCKPKAAPPAKAAVKPRPGAFRKSGTPHTGAESQEDPPELEEKAHHSAHTPPSSTDSGSSHDHSSDGKATPPKAAASKRIVEPAALDREDSFNSQTDSIASHPGTPKPPPRGGTVVQGIVIPPLNLQGARKNTKDPKDLRPKPVKQPSQAVVAAFHGKPKKRKAATGGTQAGAAAASHLASKTVH